MKYLEYTPLDRINDFLSQVNLGERTIKGCLEAYSCKHAGTDKKLSLSLENEEQARCGSIVPHEKRGRGVGAEKKSGPFFQFEIQILDQLGKSSDSESSHVEYLFNRSSRKTMIYLLLTLHHMYPDYDFSAVRAHEFFTEENWDSFKQIFDVYMFEASKEWLEESGTPLHESLHKALDEVVKLSECEIYSYNPEAEADPFLEKGSIWSYHFFFYNRKLKRVVSFCFRCISNLSREGYFDDESSNEEDGEVFDSMDI